MFITLKFYANKHHVALIFFSIDLPAEDRDVWHAMDR